MFLNCGVGEDSSPWTCWERYKAGEGEVAKMNGGDELGSKLLQ